MYARKQPLLLCVLCGCTIPNNSTPNVNNTFILETASSCTSREKNKSGRRLLCCSWNWLYPRMIPLSIRAYRSSKNWLFDRQFRIGDFKEGPGHWLPNLYKHIKGTVQRELRWVKIGINRTVRINCIAGKCHLPCPKGHHHERSINILDGCNTFWRHPNRLGQ